MGSSFLEGASDDGKVQFELSDKGEEAGDGRGGSGGRGTEGRTSFFLRF